MSVSMIMPLLAVLPAGADVNVTQNIAFTANGRNPWAPGPAIEVSDSYTLLDIPKTNVNFPTINADPVGVALDALSDALGVPLPSLVKLQVGGSASGTAHVGVDFLASLGRLNINYPARSTLNVQTIPGGNYVRANQPFTIGSTFSPGVTQLDVPISHAVTVGGNGYGDTALFGPLTFTTYDTPKFTTTAPWAEAKLIATADVRAGVFAQVSALGGLKKWRADYKFGGPIGGPIIEIDPTGLYVAGEKKFGVDLTAPYTFNIPGGSATAQLPKLGTSGALVAPGSHVLHADTVSPVFTVDGDLEKLIPFVGSFLKGNLGPVGYDLLHLGGGPVISVYQDQTFTPDPLVRLTFSEPVMVGGQPTTVADFPLGSPINWSPMFSNSSQLTIVPQYILKNTFSNVTGLDLSLQLNVDSLSFTAPYIPGGPPDGHTIGPLLETTTTIPIGRIPLPFINRDPWEISLGTITGDAITVPKSNLDVVTGLGDLSLVLAQLISGTPGSGDATYELHFNRTVVGEPPRAYQATVAGVGSILSVPDGDGYTDVGLFKASQDVILTDPVTSEQFNIGRDFGLSNFDLAYLLPTVGPAFIVEDPNNPGQNLPPLYVTTLPDIPNTDVDVATHPAFGFQDTSWSNYIQNSTYGTEVVDLRESPTTTILAHKNEFNPEGDGRFNSFSGVVMNAGGDIAFYSSLGVVVPGAGASGFYFADETGTTMLVRVGDPVPGGSGTITSFGAAIALNDAGQAALLLGMSNSFSNSLVVRSGPDGLKVIARNGQTAPDGNGTFQDFSTPALNNAGQVLFWSRVTHPTLGTDEVIYASDGSTLSEIARQGDGAPGLPGQMSSFGYYSLNNSGQAAFDVYTTGNVQGLYIRTGNNLNLVAADGGAVPGGGAFVGINQHDLNNAGQVAFAAGLREFPGGPLMFGLFRGDDASTVQIAREGQLAPDQDGTLTWQLISSFQVNDVGQVAFLGFVDAASDYRAILLGDGGNLTQIARYGMTIPDGTGQITGLSGPRLNNQGHVAFDGTFGDDDDVSGVFLYDGTNLIQVVRSGQPLAGGIVSYVTVAGINEDMQVAYRASLADGREIVARFEPTIYWRNPGDGDWAAADDWSLRVEPTNPYDVFIVAENALTVSGPAVNRTVKSLTIGGEDTASATLDLTSGVTLTATNGTTIRANGTLNYPFGAQLVGPLVNDGTLNGPTTPGQFLNFASPVGGSGTFNGNVRFSNEISPGNSPGVLTIDGDLELGAAATFRIELGGSMIGSQYDSLVVTGSVLLDGTLDVDFIDGFAPALGNQFTALTFAARSGDFTNYNGLNVVGHVALRPTFTSTSLLLTARPAVDGDINLDGTVDIFDVNSVSANWGTAGPQGDANGDGIVDIFDVNLISASWGATGGTAAAVPEPATIVLGLLGVTLLGLRFTHRSRLISHAPARHVRVASGRCQASRS